MVHIFRKSRTNLLLFYFAQLCYKVVKKYEIWKQVKNRVYQIIKKRNETIEILEKREAVLQKQLENYSDSNVLKLIDDLKKQKKVQAEIINELRRGRAELLQLIGDLTVKIQKGGVG